MTPLVNWIVFSVVALPGLCLIFAAIIERQFFRQRRWECWDIGGGPAFDSGAQSLKSAVRSLLRLAYALFGEAGARALMMMLGASYIVIMYWVFRYFR